MEKSGHENIKIKRQIKLKYKQRKKNEKVNQKTSPKNDKKTQYIKEIRESDWNKNEKNTNEKKETT